MTRWHMQRGLIVLVAGLSAAIAGAEEGEAAFRTAIEADWARQEARLERAPTDVTTIHAIWARTQRLLDSLSNMTGAPDLAEEAATLSRLRREVEGVSQQDEAGRLALYHEVRWLARNLALKNPLVPKSPLVFMERKRFICQMLHEYMGYYYDYGDIDGGGVYVLEDPGRSFAVRDLVRGRLPRGNYTTLSLSYDAGTLYFAFAKRAAEKPDFDSPERECFHLFAMDPDGENLRQLTFGPEDDFDPCPLPDGGLAFMSTRRGGFTRCNNPWEPLPANTLHRMNADGTGVRTLSVHETSEWHPSVLHDGSIVYIRWDYVDRSAAHFHGLWLSNPDGTNPRHLFGSYTQRINACYQPKAIPGSHKIAFLAGAHHADVGGSLVLLDPKRLRFDAESGHDRFEAIEVLTPEVCFPEAPGWPSSYFHSPWPLSEDYFLISFSFDPLPGMGPGVEEDTETGLYLFDRFGNLELLYREEGVSCMYPLPLAPRPVPRAIPSTADPSLGEEGVFMLANVNRGHFALPEGRPVRELRVFQLLPKSETHIANKPRLGYANAESARMLLGTVPVEADGSAYFRAPARKPLVFQAVDADGRAVYGMRSATYLQPGEKRSCVGCHEPIGSGPTVRPTLAMQREPSRLQPGPDGSMPWSFPRLVQPVLDAHCVRCHDGGEEASLPNLTAEPAETFTASYEGLKPYARWYEWGKESIASIITVPGRMPSDESPLTAILGDDNHRKAIALGDEDRRRLYLWLDANAAFYGAYSEEERLAQKRGETIPPPKLQ